MKKSTAAGLFIMWAGIIGLLAACAGTPATKATAKSLPEMLRESGFKAYPANTPQEMAHLRTCPAGTLMIEKRPGSSCYAFADPAAKTMYLGDEAAYRRLQDLFDQQQQKLEQQKIESDPQFWEYWGHKFGGG